jgi:hypothetical protein
MTEQIIIKVPAGIAKLSLMFCGCGDPDSAWETVREYLECYEKWGIACHDGTCIDIAASYQPKLETGADWIVAYVLDHAGLTEHGSNVRGAWLTEGGDEALAFLKAWGDDWERNSSVHFLDEQGISHGNG